MGRLQVAPSGTYFVKDGKPFFLLSDTIWMAFQKLRVRDWEEIVRLRYEQGFTALQISVLPIAHDNAKSERDLQPFRIVGGKYDFASVNPAYFDHAEQMLAVMRRYGLTPFLHLFWVNYVPDTWGAACSPDTVIPQEYVEGLARYMVSRFKKYDPIYSVSGDTQFETPRVTAFYKTVLDVLYELDPEGLTTLHLHPDGDPPENLCAHPQYHFYAYQSGHNISAQKGLGQSNMLRLSKRFLDKKDKKPVINTEPCYEGHGFGGEYGRFGASDVRRAIWRSLLSGACAGVTYGAHGIWQVFEAGDSFNNPAFSSMPYTWRNALHFEGAWDAGYAKWLFTQYGMERLSPSKAYRARSDELCMGIGDGLVVLYLPYNDDVTVCMDLRGYNVTAAALDSRCILRPTVEYGENETTILRSSKNEDILLIALREV